MFRVSVVKMHPDQWGERFCKILQSGQSEVEGKGHRQGILKVLIDRMLDL